MRMSQVEKDRSHKRIITSASRMLREYGLSGSSVADVMKDAGMTHGGFYKHFDSKDALVERALDHAFSELVELLQSGDAEETFAAYKAIYLSADHVKQPGTGCPVAALGPEIARSSTRLKTAFGRGVRRIVDAIAGSQKGSAAARRTAALREASMLVGAIIIARASDSEMANDVLAACGGEARNVQ